MATEPTGRMIVTAGGRDLVLTRSFPAPITEIWADLTVSERTARWFASWTGEGAPGRTVRYRMPFEEGDQEGEMTIEACAPPHHLTVSTTDVGGVWRLEANLTETEGTTVLTLVHHLDDQADVGSIGPGWEFYLDRLVAVRSGGPPPVFDDYYPAQQAYYEGLG